MKLSITASRELLGSLILLGEVLAMNKRGVGWHIGEELLAPVAPLLTAESNIGWWYDWNVCYGGQCGSLFSKDRKEVGDPAENGAVFVPMIWTKHTFYEETELQKGHTAILHFNEPDRKENDGMSEFVEPADAAKEWKVMVDTLQKDRPDDWKDIKLISPAMANDPGWLVAFFNALCGDQSANKWKTCSYEHPPQTVAVHAYEMTAGGIIGKVEQFHDTFDRPIALTEFALAAFGGGVAAPAAVPHAEVEKFMRDCIDFLEDTDWVEMYAWFGASRKAHGMGGVGDNCRLMDTSGQLTDLGKLYISLPAKEGGPAPIKSAEAKAKVSPPPPEQKPADKAPPKSEAKPEPQPEPKPQAEAKPENQESQKNKDEDNKQQDKAAAPQDKAQDKPKEEAEHEDQKTAAPPPKSPPADQPAPKAPPASVPPPPPQNQDQNQNGYDDGRWDGAKYGNGQWDEGKFSWAAWFRQFSQKAKRHLDVVVSRDDK